MGNLNYRKGRRKEYKIKLQLEAQGYTVLRAAGSHGFADLVAIDNILKKIRLIQCKPDDFSIIKARELKNEWAHMEGTYEVTFEVI